MYSDAEWWHGKKSQFISPGFFQTIQEKYFRKMVHSNGNARQPLFLIFPILSDYERMDLKADLDNYLNRSNNGSKSTFSNFAQGFKLPTLSKPQFSDSSVPDEDAVSLLEGGQDTLAWFGTPKNNESCSCLPSLSKKQRALGFMTFLGLGLICFGLALAYIPVLIIYARKFSLLFSLGSCFTMGRSTGGGSGFFMPVIYKVI